MVERREKSNNETLFRHQILILFADNTGLTTGSDLVWFGHLLCFSKIEGSIIP